MKLLFFLSLCTFVTISCSTKHEEEKVSYIETIASFCSFRNSDISKVKWARDTKTLKMFHETFKKIGYNDLISADLYDSNPFIEMGVYINRPLHHLLDSLLLTYKQDSIDLKYYREFWNRRVREGNDSMVYVIIKDIKASAGTEYHEFYDKEFVNDTLHDLLLIEYRSRPFSKAMALENFSMLHKYGFHQSAHNLVFCSEMYGELDWNKDSLNTLLVPSKKESQAVWFNCNAGP